MSPETNKNIRFSFQVFALFAILSMPCFVFGAAQINSSQPVATESQLEVSGTTGVFGSFISISNSKLNFTVDPFYSQEQVVSSNYLRTRQTWHLETISDDTNSGSLYFKFTYDNAFKPPALPANAPQSKWVILGAPSASINETFHDLSDYHVDGNSVNSLVYFVGLQPTIFANQSSAKNIHFVADVDIVHNARELLPFSPVMWLDALDTNGNSVANRLYSSARLRDRLPKPNTTLGNIDVGNFGYSDSLFYHNNHSFLIDRAAQKRIYVAPRFLNYVVDSTSLLSSANINTLKSRSGPTYRYNQINGNPAIYFAGDQGLLFRPSSTSFNNANIADAASGGSIATVIQQGSKNTDYQTIFEIGSRSSNCGIGSALFFHSKSSALKNQQLSSIANGYTVWGGYCPTNPYGSNFTPNTLAFPNNYSFTNPHFGLNASSTPVILVLQHSLNDVQLHVYNLNAPVYSVLSISKQRIHPYFMNWITQSTDASLSTLKQNTFGTLGINTKGTESAEFALGEFLLFKEQFNDQQRHQVVRYLYEKWHKPQVPSPLTHIALGLEGPRLVAAQVVDNQAGTMPAVSTLKLSFDLPVSFSAADPNWPLKTQMERSFSTSDLVFESASARISVESIRPLDLSNRHANDYLAQVRILVDPNQPKIGSARLNLFSGHVSAKIGGNEILAPYITNLYSSLLLTYDVRESTFTVQSINIEGENDYLTDYSTISVVFSTRVSGFTKDDIQLSFSGTGNVEGIVTNDSQTYLVGIRLSGSSTDQISIGVNDRAVFSWYFGRGVYNVRRHEVFDVNLSLQNVFLKYQTDNNHYQSASKALVLRRADTEFKRAKVKIQFSQGIRFLPLHKQASSLLVNTPYLDHDTLTLVSVAPDFLPMAPVFWLDAADLDGDLNNSISDNPAYSTAVSSWIERMSSVVFNTSGLPPMFYPKREGQNPTVRFINQRPLKADISSSQSALFSSLASSSSSYFFLIQPTDYTTGTFFAFGDTNNSNNYLAFSMPTTNQFSVQFGFYDDSTDSVISLTNINSSSPMILALIKPKKCTDSCESSVMDLHVRGFSTTGQLVSKQVKVPYQQNLNLTTISSFGFRLGALLYSLFDLQHYGGDLFESLIFNDRLSTREIDQVLDYLQNKWLDSNAKPHAASWNGVSRSLVLSFDVNQSQLSTDIFNLQFNSAANIRNGVGSTITNLSSLTDVATSFIFDDRDFAFDVYLGHSELQRTKLSSTISSVYVDGVATTKTSFGYSLGEDFSKLPYVALNYLNTANLLATSLPLSFKSDILIKRF